MADQPKLDPVYQQWVKAIADYDREFKRWDGRVEKILKRYRDENRITKDGSSRFNILWSNVQTSIPAVFSRLPKPDVSRRFRDSDPIGRVSALLLERALDFEIEHYTDYRFAMKSSVQDRFLGGRGTSWARYDIPDDALEHEHAATDYVYWKDFGHTMARTWDEVTAVWRRIYMGREALVARFGEELGGKIPLDTKPFEKKETGASDAQQSEAAIYEIWDKKTETALWISKSLGQILDQKDDPLELEDFFPCPKPLYATLTNDSLVPVPDYTLYQDQAQTLNILSDRIDGLVKAMQVKGVYDATIPELARLFTEGENGTLIGVKNWQAFVEKQGLKGAIDVVDLQPIYEALKASFEAFQQIVNNIYQLTGLSDIIRGESDPRETAEAVKTKGMFGSMRLRSMQTDVAQYATELLQIKAQIICAKYQPETIMQIGGAQTLSKEDQTIVPQAIELLKNSTLRDFRIEIISDSMIYMDEVQEKSDRMEMATAVGNYLKAAIPAGTEMPQMAPLLMDMLKFIVTGFRVGKTIEGSFDALADQMKQLAANPQPKQDPAMAKVQAEAQADQQRMQMEAQKSQAELQAKQAYDQFKANLDAQVAQAAQQAQAQQDAQAQQMEAQREQQKAQLQAQLEQHKANLAAQTEANRIAFEKYKADLDAQTKIAVAEIAAKTTLAAAQLSAARAEATGGQVKDKPAAQPQET